jgi:tetratricopeptide (TPR) repeat protein
MATYPGNPTLPAEVRDRVLSTFRHAVDLYKKGQTDEAISGCTLIASMDPQFVPARKLVEKIGNQAAAVDVDALLKSVGTGPDVLDQARTALAARDFERAEQIAEAVLSEDFTNEAAQEIAQSARHKIEAQPFVEQFIEKARTQRASGNETAAKATIEKARALDPEHPGLSALGQEKPRTEQPAANAPLSFDFGGESSPFSSAFSSQAPPQSPAQAPPKSPAPVEFTMGANPFEGPTTGSAPPTPPPAPPSAEPLVLEDPSGSFVVEPPATPTRGSAEASDFGFTFEEDQKGAEAAAPAPQLVPGSAGTFDFSTASVEVTAEDQSKISKYLQEGDAAFERGDYQKAIDLWSRIFLIDVTNDEASARIEKARARRVETDRKVEDLIATGTQAYDRGDQATARAKFEEALKMDPTNFTASDYLERLASGVEPTPPPPGAIPSATPGAPENDLFAEEFEQTPEAAEAPGARPRPRPSRSEAVSYAPAAKPKTMMYVIIGVVVLVLAAAGYFGFSMLTGGDDDIDVSRTAQAFTEAQTLASRGQYDGAISLLSAVKPEDPQYDRALAMIADLQKKKAQAAALQTPVNPAAFGDLVARAQAAYASHDYATAKQLYERAAQIEALPPNLKSQYDAAARQVARTQTASVLFKEGNYREALTALEAMRLQDPENANIRQMISHAHFNLGQVALERERTQEAITHFDQVLATNPSDEMARRSRDLAARYNNEAKDLLYKIYVKYLPLRGI